MIKIPLRDLRAAFADPANYVHQHSEKATGRMRATKYGAFRNAVFQYHSSEGNLKSAQDYLEAKFETFKNQAELPEYLVKLSKYAKEFELLGTELVRTRANVALKLPEAYSDFRVSGQIARLDITKAHGYNVWTFVRGDTDWKSDPRMPLLQEAAAKRLNADLADVEVGVYDFIAGEHYWAKFSPSQINAVRKKLVQLLDAFKS
jgi:hypothetical protein